MSDDRFVQLQQWCQKHVDDHGFVANCVVTEPNDTIEDVIVYGEHTVWMSINVFLEMQEWLDETVYGIRNRYKGP